ncbi:uncharacterized protein [Dysidea avara]
MLEENLHQLSRITRQERKQLSDELESVSVSGSNAVSFQQKLLLLSNKQKALLNCFEEQKRLGAQLKLMSGQSRYCTRSKGLLGSFGQVKEEVTGHVTKSLLQPTKTRKQSSSFSLLTESATQSTTKHRQQPVGVAKQQQRSVGVSKQQLVSVTKHPVGVAKKQQQPVDVPKQQQPVGVAKQQPQSLGVAKQQQQLVGVVKRQQQQQVGIAKQQQQMSVAVVDMVQQPVGVVQQPVGVAQQSVGVAKQLTDIVPEQVAQKQVQFVGVATQQKSPDITLPLIGASYQQEIVQPVDVYKQQQPGGVAAQPRGVTQQLSAFVIAQQQRVGVTKKQQQPVGVAKQSVGVSQKQPGSVPLASQCAVQPMGETNQPGTTRLLQSELAQPVPLDVLINHSLMIPQDQLNCTLLGCQFTGSVTQDGSVVSQDGQRFSQLPQWVNSCWATLGHNKRVDRKTAYTKVTYKGSPLLHSCLLYSQQKVSNYLSQSQNATAHTTTPVEKPHQTQLRGILDIKHDKCRVCLISDNELVPSDDWLPCGFWDSDMILVNHDMEHDLIY